MPELSNRQTLDETAAIEPQEGIAEKPVAHRSARELGHEWLAAAMLLVLDLVAWLAVYAVATSTRGDRYYVTPVQLIVIEGLQLAIILGSLFTIGGYNRHTEMRGLSYATEHVLAVLWAAALSSLLVYAAATFDQSMRPSRAVILVSFAIFIPLSLSYRRTIRGAVAAATANRAFLVVGSGPVAAEFYRAYKNSVSRERLEFVDPEGERAGEHIAGPGSPVIERDLATKLERLDQSYSGVIVAERIDRLRPELLERLVRTQFQNVRVYTLESFHEAHWRHVPVQSLDPFWPLQTGFQLARSSPYHYAKRLFDVALASVLLVLCAPLMGVIGLVIWWENGWPVIFRQTRVGRDNELFTVMKFRTMGLKKVESGNEKVESGEGGVSNAKGERRKAEGISNAECAVTDAQQRPGFQMRNAEVSEIDLRSSNFELPNSGTELQTSNFELPEEDDLYTRENDPRITRVGRWLRKARFDELPQLWNVFRGEMSLIGPRAEWIRCAERYEKSIPFYHFRHLVKPGITGWAQVNYGYGESDEDAIEKLKYDLYYIRNYSLKLDLMIVFKTVFTVLFGKGR